MTAILVPCFVSSSSYTRFERLSSSVFDYLADINISYYLLTSCFKFYVQFHMLAYHFSKHLPSYMGKKNILFNIVQSNISYSIIIRQLLLVSLQNFHNQTMVRSSHLAYHSSSNYLARMLIPKSGKKGILTLFPESLNSTL